MEMGDNMHKKGNIVIFVLLVILLCMAVGYSAFQSILNISGVSKITSNWDIEITNIRSSNLKTNGYDIENPVYTKSSANFKSGLIKPGDSMIYEVEVSNLGTIDGKISITNFSCGNNSSIICKVGQFSGKSYDDNWNLVSSNLEMDVADGKTDFSTKGITINSKEKKYLYISVTFDSNATSVPSNTFAEITLNLNYVQNDGDTVKDAYLLTYDYSTNGGSYSTLDRAYYKALDEVDLTPTAFKSSTLFLGWNTDKNASSGLDSYQINKDTVLYAIFSKKIEVVFTESGTNPKTVKISLPQECSGVYTCTYQKNNEAEVTVTNDTEVTYTEDGSLVVKISNDKSSISTSYMVNIDDYYVSSIGSDDNEGSLNQPFKTIEKAYNKLSNRASTIHLLSDITPDSNLSFNQNKIVTIMGDDTTFSIIRSSASASTSDEPDYFIKLVNGTLSLNNVIVEGSSISSKSGLVNIVDDATLNLNSNSAIQNGNCSYWFGCGIRIDDENGGTVNLNGGVIQNNNKAAIHAGSKSTVNVNSGKIINNSMDDKYSGGINSIGTVNYINGTIKDNTSSDISVNNFKIYEDGKFYDKKLNYTSTKSFSLGNYIDTNYRLDVDDATVADNTNIKLWKDNQSNAQSWKLLPGSADGDVIYYFQSQIDGTQYMWITNNSFDDGANVITHSMNTNSGGYWYLIKTNDYYYIKSINNNLCLDVADTSLTNGVNVLVSTCSDSKSQRWKFVS